MKLSVKSLSGMIYLEVLLTSSMLDVKYMIQRQEPTFTAWKQRLFRQTDELVELDNHATVTDVVSDHEELVLLMHAEFCPLSQQEFCEILNHENAVDQRLVEERFNLLRQHTYLFPLRRFHPRNKERNASPIEFVKNHTAISSLDVNWINIMPKAGQWVDRQIDFDRYVISGTYTNMAFETEPYQDGQSYTMWIELEAPIRLYVKDSDIREEDINLMKFFGNAIHVMIHYYNLVPCVEELEYEFTGKRSLRKSIRKYIRRSIKKELKKLQK